MPWQGFPGHDRVLETRRLILRPFRESDLEVERAYYADPELREAFEGDANAALAPEGLRAAALYLASWGCLFALELKAECRTVGEACLERMNLERAGALPGERVFRLPIAIWDRRLWGQGLGGEALDRLLEEAFGIEAADRLCAMDVKRDNARSRGLFESRGFRIVRHLGDVLDLELSREAYSRRQAQQT